MNAVIIDCDISYPATSGKRLRTLNLMIRMAKRHHITYVARRASPTVDAALAADFLGDHGIDTVFVDHRVPSRQSPLFPLRLAANFLSPEPYATAVHSSRKMRNVLQGIAAARQVDLWQVEWPPYLDMLKGCPLAVPRVAVAPNVDTLIWERYYTTAAGKLKRWVLRQQWQKMKYLERRVFADADRVIAVSEEDAQLVREKFQQPNVDVVDNGIDRQFYESAKGQRRPQQILFLGALDYQPNADAVELLLNEIFPHVLGTAPQAELHIVGRRAPTHLAQQIRNTSGARLHADVPDVRPFLAESAVMAVPLRIGGGSRLKILEALACGLPVVSTQVGAEGLNLQPGEHYVHAEPSDMAAALANVLNNPDNANTMAEKGREVVLEQYDWDHLADKLDNIWERCVQIKRDGVFSLGLVATVCR